MSEQMDNLLRAYGVQTEAQLVRAIQDEYELETNERPTKRVAQVILDRMLEAEYQRIEGGGREGPWRSGYGEYPFADEVADIRGQGASDYEWYGDDR